MYLNKYILLFYYLSLFINTKQQTYLIKTCYLKVKYGKNNLDMHKVKNNTKIKKALLINENVKYSGAQNKSTDISLIQYDDTTFNIIKNLEYNKINENLKNDYKNWLIISGLSDYKKISEIFLNLKLSNIDTRTILEIGEYSIISDYVDKILFRTNHISINKGENLRQDQISFILGDNYLITFLESEIEIFNDVISAIEDSKVNLRTKACDYLLIILLDKIISEYRNIVSNIEQELERYTDLVIEAKEKDDLLVDAIADRKVYIKLKHIIVSIKDNLNKMSYNKNKLIAEENSIYLSDIIQQLQFIAQDIDNCDQAFNSILNLHFNNNSQKMNDIMKRLTIISTIFIPMTFFVGLWGMNFKNMPETNLEYGYFIALFIIIISAIASWFYLKRKKWL